MLVINEGDTYPLPQEYHFTHNLCAIIYDQLADTLANEKYKSLSATGFSINPENESRVKELENGSIHILDWLAKYAYNQALSEFLKKTPYPFYSCRLRQLRIRVT